nr:hypothetical protein WS54_13270 [Burkholderia sp. NRF60-BP8]
MNEHVNEQSAPSLPAQVYFKQDRIHEKTDGPHAPFEQFPCAEHVQRQCGQYGKYEASDCSASQDADPSPSQARSKRTEKDAVPSQFFQGCSEGFAFHCLTDRVVDSDRA